MLWWSTFVEVWVCVWVGVGGRIWVSVCLCPRVALLSTISGEIAFAAEWICLSGGNLLALGLLQAGVLDLLSGLINGLVAVLASGTSVWCCGTGGSLLRILLLGLLSLNLLNFLLGLFDVL